MRAWYFHPLIFYPLALVLAVLVIAVSLKPQAWPRAPAPAAAEVDGETLLFAGEAFNAPADSPEQEMMVVRDFFGRAQALRIAVLPGQPPPTPAEQGVRILFTPQQAALLEDRPAVVEVDYAPLPVNAADGLAVSLQGIGPADWVSQPAPPQPGTLRFDLPAQFALNGVGLRALSQGEGQAYGLEISAVRVTPQGDGAAAN